MSQALLEPRGGSQLDDVLETIIEFLGKIGSDSPIEAILKPLPSNTCLDKFATNTLRRVGSLKIIPQLWNIPLKAKYKTYFCEAIEEIQPITNFIIPNWAN